MQRMIKNKGFTLVEIMVSMVISGLVFSGIYGVYTIQQRSYTLQEQVTEIQQKIRGAMDFMARDVRMAGYDDPNEKCSGSRILTANAAVFEFECCDPLDTDDPTFFRYGLYDANDDGSIDLGHTRGGMTQVLAEGVDAIEFLYFDTDGKLGTSVPFTDMADIRSVQISMLVRGSYPDRRYTNTIPYKPASELPDDGSAPVWDINGTAAGTGNPANDNYHRRLLITRIVLRNMGLK